MFYNTMLGFLAITINVKEEEEIYMMVSVYIHTCVTYDVSYRALCWYMNA